MPSKRKRAKSTALVVAENLSNYVRLDVGGLLFLTHKSTLMKYEDSMLAKLVAPENDTRKSSDEFIKIDRNGKQFSSILGYLREDGSLDFDSLKEKDLSELCFEADYYNLMDLVELCQAELNRRASPPDEPKKLTRPQKEIPFYLDYDRLINHLKAGQQTALIVNAASFSTVLKYFNGERLRNLAELCFPIPLFLHACDQGHPTLAIFEKDSIEDQEILHASESDETSDSRILDFVTQLRRNNANYT